MKEFFKNLKNDKLLLRLFIASFVLIIIAVAYILINFNNLPPLLPIFNQLPWGEKRLGETWTIFFPLIVVFVILIINIIVSNFIYKFSPLISRMLAITSFITALLALLFVIRTITVII